MGSFSFLHFIYYFVEQNQSSFIAKHLSMKVIHFPFALYAGIFKMPTQGLRSFTSRGHAVKNLNEKWIKVVLHLFSIISLLPDGPLLCDVIEIAFCKQKQHKLKTPTTPTMFLAPTVKGSCLKAHLSCIFIYGEFVRNIRNSFSKLTMEKVLLNKQ